MASLSIYLYVLGGVALFVAFILDVIHTTSLAGGRRTVATGALAGGGQAQVATAALPGGGHGQVGTVAVSAGSGPLSYRMDTQAGSIGHAFTWIAFIAFVGSLAIRAHLVGRGPWGNMFEFSVAFATGITGGYLYLARRYAIRSIAFLPLGVALFLIGYASTLPSTIEPLVPALANPPLITIHVVMAVLSYGIFAVSFGAAVGYLIQGEKDRFAWLPTHKVLDEVAYRAVIIGFPIFAGLIILGSYWASIAWGRYWGWDPKETSALVTWLIYAVYLHARSLRGWAGRPAALMLVIGFGAVLFTYFGNLYFSGLHAYSGL